MPNQDFLLFKEFESLNILFLFTQVKNWTIDQMIKELKHLLHKMSHYVGLK